MASFIRYYFPGADVDQIGEEDLRQFLAQDLEEGQTLEYVAVHMVLNEDGSEKRPQDIEAGHSSKKAQKPAKEYRVGWKAVARVVAAFANAEGGLLVLGVDERDEEDDRRRTVRIHPGNITPFPSSVTREVIQERLNSLIRFEVEGLHIHPVRLQSNGAVYLIDVPQSCRPPHRVAEQWYFQRYNSLNLQMKHYQIADAFGRRLAPDLDVTILRVDRPYQGPHVRVTPVILNKGRSIAKHAYCQCVLASDDYVLTGGSKWPCLPSGKAAALTVKYPAALYPDVPYRAGHLEFCQADKLVARTPIALKFRLYAEGMPYRDVGIVIDPVRQGWRRMTAEERQALEQRLSQEDLG